jgi:hypothetical protein
MLKPLLNNQYKYDCVNGSSETPENHSEVMLTSLQIPYRWYNIPDGVYTTRSVNAHIQQLCIDNGLCFIEDRTPYCFVYYLSDPYNAAYCANQVLSTTVPTSLPT